MSSKALAIALALTLGLTWIVLGGAWFLLFGISRSE